MVQMSATFQRVHLTVHQPHTTYLTIVILLNLLFHLQLLSPILILQLLDQSQSLLILLHNYFAILIPLLPPIPLSIIPQQLRRPIPTQNRSCILLEIVIRTVIPQSQILEYHLDQLLRTHTAHHMVIYHQLNLLDLLE